MSAEISTRIVKTKLRQKYLTTITLKVLEGSYIYTKELNLKKKNNVH
jgi:hypothetical protein